MSETTEIIEAPVIIEEGELVVGAAKIIPFIPPRVPVSNPLAVPELIGQRKDVEEVTEEDGHHVVKVRDAIQCCQDFMNSNVVSSVIVASIRSVLMANPQLIDDYFEHAMHLLAECIRKKALQQSNAKHARRRKGVTRRRRHI
jgi:hypothetical protein